MTVDAAHKKPRDFACRVAFYFTLSADHHGDAEAPVTEASVLALQAIEQRFDRLPGEGRVEIEREVEVTEIE